MLSECEICQAVVQIEEKGSFVSQNEYDSLDSIKYLLCKCVQCGSPILLRQHLIWTGREETDWGKTSKIFPQNQFHVNPEIPEALQTALLESIKCYKTEAFTATAIMCRRTIEGFCVLQNASEGNLDKSIKKLKDTGQINEQLFDWANQLRLVGNEAAHNINAVFSGLDAKDILDFTIAILDFTYSFKEKFEKFRHRHTSK